ncbi:MAG: ParB/RepB/Spo0J family partition protein [Acidimicrobiia bacterium]
MTDRGVTRTGLGRGLSALLPDDPAGGPVFREVSIDKVHPNPRQPRTHFDDEAITALADSIKRLGVLQPLLCRRDGTEFELIAGERRLRAARLAGLDEVPILLREASEESSLEEALLENLHREDLNALEEAAAFHQLIEDFGLTHESLSSRVGKSRAAISNTLRLLNLPSPVQELLVGGEISGGHARALLGIPDQADQIAVAARVAREGWTVRQTEEYVRRRSAGTTDKTDKAPQPAHPALLEVGDLMGEYLDTQVEVKMRRGAGRMVIEFGSLSDLERIAARILGESS